MSGMKKRFTVMWTAQGQERRSALMTEQEANKFVGRLQKENAVGLKVQEDTKESSRAAQRGA
ncbi:MAG: hypothetical protein EXQ95_03280 [Alphaproteobacteria bacterium]|nr:hypothetical protein [Alphaproteobacteria bacterium]